MENNWLNLMHLLKKMFMIVKKDHKSDSKEEGLDKIVAEKKSEINDLNEKTVKVKKLPITNHSLFKASIFTFCLIFYQTIQLSQYINKIKKQIVSDFKLIF